MWQNMLTLLMLPVGWGVQKHMDKIKKYIQSISNSAGLLAEAKVALKIKDFFFSFLPP